MKKSLTKSDCISFVYNLEQVKIIKNKGYSNCLFVLCEPGEFNSFKDSNIDFIELDNFIESDIFKNFPNQIFDFSTKLFEDFSKYSLYQGLNYGKIISHDLQFIFSEPIYLYKQIKPIIDHYNPKKVFVFNNSELCKKYIYKLYATDPIFEILQHLKNEKDYNYDLKIYSSKVPIKKNMKNLATVILKILQRYIYLINPYRHKGDKIVLAGSLRNVKSMIKSPLSKNYKFFSLFNFDALEFNLSKSFFFINFSPIFNKSRDKEFFEKKFQEIILDNDFKKRFIFFKEDFYSLLDGRLKILFESVFPFMAYLQHNLENFYKKNKPQAVYAITDVELFEGLLVNIANNFGIPTFISQYGVNSFILPESYWPSFSKYKVVWGESDKDMFIKKNVKKQNIFVVGESRLYDYKNKVVTSRDDLLKEVGAPLDKKIVLYISPYVSFNKSRRYIPGMHLLPKENMDLLKVVLNSFKENPGIHLLISLGIGSDEPRIIKNLLKKYDLKNVTIIEKKYSPNDRINACDAIIPGYSTTGLEAMLLEKILFIYKFKNKEDVVEYLKFKAGYGFKTTGELSRLLKNFNNLKTTAYKNNQKKYLKYYLRQEYLDIFKKIIEIVENEKNKNNPTFGHKRTERN